MARGKKGEKKGNCFQFSSVAVLPPPPQFRKLEVPTLSLGWKPNLVSRSLRLDPRSSSPSPTPSAAVIPRIFQDCITCSDRKDHELGVGLLKAYGVYAVVTEPVDKIAGPIFDPGSPPLMALEASGVDAVMLEPYKRAILWNSLGSCGIYDVLNPGPPLKPVVDAVVPEHYKRAFLRHSLASHGIYPLESEVRLREGCETGDVINEELGERQLNNRTADAGPVVETGGGGMARGRQNGMTFPSYWAPIIFGTVCNLAMVTTLLLVKPRNITINYMLPEQRQKTTTSIEGQNKFAISLFNFKGSVN